MAQLAYLAPFRLSGSHVASKTTVLCSKGSLQTELDRSSRLLVLKGHTPSNFSSKDAGLTMLLQYQNYVIDGANWAHSTPLSAHGWDLGFTWYCKSLCLASQGLWQKLSCSGVISRLGDAYVSDALDSLTN
jgi:hypothetical protein